MLSTKEIMELVEKLDRDRDETNEKIKVAHPESMTSRVLNRRLNNLESAIIHLHRIK